MRSVLLVVIAAAIVAGCASPASNPSTATTPPTTAPTTPASSGPVAIKSDTHDFTADAASGTPAAGSASTALTIPAGVSSLDITVKFAPANGAPGAVSDGISVKVGTVTCSVAAGPVTAPSTCTGKSDAAGVKAILYSGAGPVVATVTIMGS
jgi:hypothetical protein